MPEVTGSDEAKPELSSVELQWRLECALKYSATSGANLVQAAEAVNKALAILRQGDCEKSAPKEGQEFVALGRDTEEVWQIEVCRTTSKFLFFKIVDGRVVESYRPVGQAEASAWAVSVIQGFQPPRDLRRFDKPAG